MNIAIVHYHLRRGGVTRVIESAVAALAPYDVNVVVLTGQDYEGQALRNVRTVPGLAYRDRMEDGPDPGALAANLAAAARDGLEGQEPDVWHVHNHSLGKNAAFAPALQELLSDGRRALLQIHDFAEDGRPHNFKVLSSGAQYVEAYGGTFLPYPLAATIRYAVLNGRDAAFLRDAGAPADSVKLLPNPVHLPSIGEPESKPYADREHLYVYPVRGIRRKNLGEVALLAAAAPHGALFVTTLTPENPAWLPIHDEWGRFCEEHGLPVQLGAVDRHGHDFAALMKHADALLNTSITEGFGMAFLEPWVFGDQLVGRDLPEITQDFLAQGMLLENLYDRLDVPIDRFDFAAFKQRLASVMDAAFRTYGRRSTEDIVQQALQSWVRQDAIDFGVLDETAQREIILQVMGDADLRRAIWARVRPVSEEARQTNRQVVLDQFSLEGYGQSLFELYQEIMEHNGEAPRESVSPDRLLDSFLEPARFRILRS